MNPLIDNQAKEAVMGLVNDHGFKRNTDNPNYEMIRKEGFPDWFGIYYERTQELYLYGINCHGNGEPCSLEEIIAATGGKSC